MAAGCIRRYFVSQLGEAAEGRVHRLYGDRLVEEMAKAPKKGMPLLATLKEPGQAKSLKKMVRLYGRIYKQATPMDVEVHPMTGKPCSHDQWFEAMTELMEL